MCQKCDPSQYDSTHLTRTVKPYLVRRAPALPAAVQRPRPQRGVVPALVQRPRPTQARTRGHPDPLVEATDAVQGRCRHSGRADRVRLRGGRGGGGRGRVVEHRPVRRPAANAGKPSVGRPAWRMFNSIVMKFRPSGGLDPGCQTEKKITS